MFNPLDSSQALQNSPQLKPKRGMGSWLRDQLKGYRDPATMAKRKMVGEGIRPELATRLKVPLKYRRSWPNVVPSEAIKAIASGEPMTVNLLGYQMKGVVGRATGVREGCAAFFFLVPDADQSFVEGKIIHFPQEAADQIVYFGPDAGWTVQLPVNASTFKLPPHGVSRRLSPLPPLKEGENWCTFNPGELSLPKPRMRKTQKISRASGKNLGSERT